MNESVPPIHPTDEPLGTPFTSRELDTADSDARVEDQRKRDEGMRNLPELTDDERAANLEQAKILRDRYDPKKH